MAQGRKHLGGSNFARPALLYTAGCFLASLHHVSGFASAPKLSGLSLRDNGRSLTARAVCGSSSPLAPHPCAPLIERRYRFEKSRRTLQACQMSMQPSPSKGFNLPSK
eukprot:1052038-Rhodomonas_salina.2